jgi:ribosomal protein S18 acetylase RimI-like enzyme
MTDSRADDTVLDDAVLDDPVGASLEGVHAPLARRHGQAAGYLPDVATFVALPAAPGPAAWADLAVLLGGSGAFADLFSSPATPPDDWSPVFALDGMQLVGPPPSGDRADETDIVELGAADVPEMLALVERTKPGPFRPRTRELGTYLGVRSGGELVAMAGERLRPPGWTELSAVCTAPEARGKGHAARLVRALIARIEARGERPFLHAAATNTPALGLYKGLGFEVRRQVTFRGFEVP